MLASGAAASYVGIGLCLAFLALEVMRSSSAEARIEKRLENAQRCACMFTGAAGDAITGLWKGIRVQVGSTADGLRIGIPLRNVSAELVIERRGRTCDTEHGRTGDDSFDQSLCIGSGDAARRSVLTAEPRRLLTTLSGQAATRLHDQALDIQLMSLESKKLEAVVDLAVAFAAALPAPTSDPPAAVFALARAEPVSSVRAGHYRWLAERGWNTQEVYRAAAADPDPAIAAWGSSHLAPSDGVFR